MAAVARGPLTFLLQSSSGQYLVLGMGAYTFFPDQVKRALAPLLASPMFAQFGLTDGSTDGKSNRMAPIIIQTPSPTVIHGGASKSLTTMVIYSVAGAGACWVGYVVCSSMLPEAIQEFMPVTKRLFKETSKTLSKGILQVKEILEEQITQLMGQQEVLEKKQDETQQSVKDVQNELGKARLDLMNLMNSLDRCEDGLNNTQAMQGYSLRGIKLLVRCITSFLPDESNFIEDISKYVEEGGNPTGTGTPGAPQQAKVQPTNRALPATSSLSMAHHSTMTNTHPAKQVFVNYDRNVQNNTPVVITTNTNNNGATINKNTVSAAPSIASIESDDYSSSTTDNNNNNFSMGDIRALMGH